LNQPYKVGDPRLKWEKTTQVDVGLEFGLLSNRISGEIDWYNSVEAVYTQIVNDLADGAAKMPESSDNFRANKYAALALLSRVYLSQLKYPEAATAAIEVIESGEYSLTSAFDTAFNNTTISSEDIFAIQQTSQSNVGTADFGMSTFYSSDPVGRGEIQVTICKRKISRAGF